jgi:Inner membrane protein YgaP-like, transmembrane domain
MTLRKGIYVVPTDRWYIERAVWLIAGTVLLASTLLALLVDPRWIFGVIATGLVSINVALTGFCPIGNALKLFGFKGALAAPNHGKLYFLQTDSWYLERRIYITVGVNITLGSILFLLHSHWWALFIGFVGTAMVWFAATGLCILANVLYWIGAEPRLNPRALRQSELRSRVGHA